MPARDRIPKAYAATPWGQVHLRDTGGEGPALLLIHQTPLAGRMWAGVMPGLAAAGWRVLAPDLLGYGRSDPRPADWSIALWADSLAAVLDRLGVERVAVMGAHVGAAVGLELALARPDQVRALALDGLPFPTPALRAAFAAMAAAPRPDHPDAARDRAAGLMRDYVPGWALGPDTVEAFWPVLTDYLETDFVSSSAIAADHDPAAQLPLWRGPLLLLGAEREPMAAALDRARELSPAARWHRWQGTHPIFDPRRAEEWAAPLIAFLETST